MFFPQEMTELEIIVPEKDLLPVTNVLARQGVFHQVDSSYLSSHAEGKVGESWKERASAYAALERQIMVTMQALAVEDGDPPSDQATLIKLEAVRPLVEQIEQDVKNTNDVLTSSTKKMEELQNHIRQLLPIADIDIDISLLQNPRYVFPCWALCLLPTWTVSRQVCRASPTFCCRCKKIARMSSSG